MAKIKKAMKGGSKVAGKGGKGGKRMESDQERQVHRRPPPTQDEPIAALWAAVAAPLARGSR